MLRLPSVYWGEGGAHLPPPQPPGPGDQVGLLLRGNSSVVLEVNIPKLRRQNRYFFRGMSGVTFGYPADGCQPRTREHRKRGGMKKREKKNVLNYLILPVGAESILDRFKLDEI